MTLQVCRWRQVRPSAPCSGWRFVSVPAHQQRWCRLHRPGTLTQVPAPCCCHRGISSDGTTAVVSPAPVVLFVIVGCTLATGSGDKVQAHCSQALKGALRAGAAWQGCGWRDIVDLGLWLCRRPKGGGRGACLGFAYLLFTGEFKIQEWELGCRKGELGSLKQSAAWVTQSLLKGDLRVGQRGSVQSFA